MGILQTQAASKKVTMEPIRVASQADIRSTASITRRSTTGTSANFLHINSGTASQLESGGSNVTGITDDFDADIRQGNPGYAGSGTAPDVGADEFTGTPVDMTPPAISYAALQRDLVAGTRSFTSVTGK